jgi:uncharacterized protein YceK
MKKKPSKIKLKNRVDGKLANANKKNIKHELNYIREDSVLCKGCSTPLSTKRESGKQGFSGNYAEITLIFDDNSAHETCVCEKCSYNMTVEKAEIVYAIDMQQWLDEDVDDLVSDDYWAYLANRIITEVKRGSRHKR